MEHERKLPKRGRCRSTVAGPDCISSTVPRAPPPCSPWEAPAKSCAYLLGELGHVDGFLSGGGHDWNGEIGRAHV